MDDYSDPEKTGPINEPHQPALPHHIRFTLGEVLNNKIMAKTFGPKSGESRPYDHGYLFNFKAVEYLNLKELADALEQLMNQPRQLLLRNELKDGVKAMRAALRREKDQPGEPATFEPETNRAVMVFDLDGVPVESPLDAPDVLLLDGKELRESLKPIFPPEFREADWLLTVTSSTGRKPGTLRLRAFVALGQPVSSAEALAFTVAWKNESKLPFDSCVCRPVQPIYTARPIFLGEETDTVPRGARVRLLRGRDRVVWMLDKARVASGKRVMAADRALRKRIGDKDWRKYLEEALGGPLSFREPLQSALGLAVLCGETEDVAVDFCLGLIGVRADAARAAHYDAGWLCEAFRSFSRREAAKPEVITWEDWVAWIARTEEFDRVICDMDRAIWKFFGATIPPRDEPEVKAANAAAGAGPKIKVGEPATARGLSNKPQVKISAGRLHEITDEVQEALHDKGLYQRGSKIVRPGHIKQKDRTGVTTYLPGIIELDVAQFRLFATDHINFLKWSQTKAKYLPGDYSLEYANALLTSGDRLDFPLLRAVTAVPVVLECGRIIQSPGYDAGTGIFYAPGNVAFPSIPEHPTKADADKALAVLRAPLNEYPFALKEGEDKDKNTSLSVALSYFLTIVNRPAFSHAPGHAFSGNGAGVGKGKLVAVGSVMATGTTPAVIRIGVKEEEFEKALSTAMLQGRGHIAIDNVDQVLKGNLLDQAISEDYIDIRIFGRLESRTVPNIYTVTATGNNIIFTDDAVRRWLHPTAQAAGLSV